METEYHKQETLTSSNPASAPNKLIRVVAPSNLPGGYQIDVQTDSDPPIMFTATVVSLMHSLYVHSFVFIIL